MIPGKRYNGKVSWFGGPDDEGVMDGEGLALYNEEAALDRPDLFLERSVYPEVGLARRLNPGVHYCACRWDYEQVPKTVLVDCLVRITNLKDPAKSVLAWPVDWGPHIRTNRIVDVSPSVMMELGVTTDDEVEVILEIK